MGAKNQKTIDSGNKIKYYQLSCGRSLVVEHQLPKLRV